MLEGKIWSGFLLLKLDEKENSITKKKIQSALILAFWNPAEIICTNVLAALDSGDGESIWL